MADEISREHSNDSGVKDHTNLYVCTNVVHKNVCVAQQAASHRIYFPRHENATTSSIMIRRIFHILF